MTREQKYKNERTKGPKETKRINLRFCHPSPWSFMQVVDTPFSFAKQRAEQAETGRSSNWDRSRISVERPTAKQSQHRKKKHTRQKVNGHRKVERARETRAPKVKNHLFTGGPPSIQMLIVGIVLNYSHPVYNRSGNWQSVIKKRGENWVKTSSTRTSDSPWWSRHVQYSRPNATKHGSKDFVYDFSLFPILS